MKKELYDTIVNNLKKNTPISVTITPANKCVEVDLVGEHLQDSPDYDFIMGEFESWFYDEGNSLTDYATANSFDFGFSMDRNQLKCDIVFIETNDPYYNFDGYNNYEVSDILTNKLMEVLLVNLGIKEEDFDEDLFDAEFNYENSALEVMNFFYDEKEIVLSSNDIKIIKADLEKLISSWELSERMEENDKRVILERGAGNILMDGPVAYSCTINLDDE